MRVDLHTHSNASDGVLEPAELLGQAIAAGIEQLALTDHDSIAGLQKLLAQNTAPVRLINGTEISAYWQTICVHIVGLDFDINHPTLLAGLSAHQQARERRATIIDQRLERAGMANTLAGARLIAGNGAIGRLHFAEHLVQLGLAKDYASAFKKYLGAGKPGDVKSEWAGIDEAIHWINAAGGIAVLAHPAKYKLTHRKLEQLVSDFKAAGGRAIEVISGAQEPGLTDRLARLAERQGLLASTGSDFHRPDQRWAALGAQPNLPDRCNPVWQHWGS